MASPSGRLRRRRPGPGGLVRVAVTNEQSDQPLDTDRWARLATDVLTARGVAGEAELSLLFVDEVAMAELNERFMGADGPTDVLAFPIEGEGQRAGPAGAPVLLGDVVICPAVAAANAEAHAGPRQGGTVVDELALLVVHGVLHVLGLDHATGDEAAAMRAAERDLLAAFHDGAS